MDSLTGEVRSAIATTVEGWEQCQHRWSPQPRCNRYSNAGGMLRRKRRIKVRLIKMFGLAAIAAVAAMAFIGASSASATNSTAACNENSVALACPAGKLSSSIHATATNPLLHSSIIDVLCSSSLISATVLDLGTAPNPQIGHTTALTWTSCHRHSGAACTVTTILEGLLLALKTKANFATLQSHLNAVRVQCGALVDCTYEGLPTLEALSATATDKGITHANTTVEKSTKNHPKSFCPNTSTWLALYESLTNVWIRS
jgi:hypothetical protein